MRPILLAGSLALATVQIVGCGGSSGNGSDSDEVYMCTSTVRVSCPETDPNSFFPSPSNQVCTETRDVPCSSDKVLDVLPDADVDIGSDPLVSINTDWQATSGDETEPNNQPNEADVFSIAPGRGYLYDGSLNDLSDTVDYLTFSVDGDGGSYSIYLCQNQSLCTEQRSQIGLYITLHDQNLVTLSSTELNIDGEQHWINAPILTTGLQYFIAIHATNTSSQDESYRLVVTD